MCFGWSELEGKGHSHGVSDSPSLRRLLILPKEFFHFALHIVLKHHADPVTKISDIELTSPNPKDSPNIDYVLSR
jgi:hypothetical protein